MSQSTPTSLTISPSSCTIDVGQSQQLTVHVFDQHGAPYTGPLPVVYNALLPAIATVSPTGLVTGVSVGVGNIQVSCGAANGGTFPNIRI